MSVGFFPPRADGKLVLGSLGASSLGSEVTIATGAITVTGSWHSVDTESDAATDDLATINGGVPGQVLVLHAQNGSRTVVCKDGSGNMNLNREFNMASVDDMLLLVKMGNDLWVELARSQNVPLLTEDPASPGYGELWYRIDLGTQGKYKFKRLTTTVYLGVEGEILMGDGNELTIATGVITVTQSYHKVDTQADAATDDLDTINGGVTGMQLVLQAINDARTVVVKDGTGNIQLDGGVDMTLDNTLDTITLIYNGSAWCELARSNNGA